jgi:DNA-binding transcriptional LysR family regulator
MNWNDMAYVLAIARDRTLLKAASTLGVAHTTVSRRLKTLEAELRVRLFDRTPDGLVATAAGEDLIEVAERIEGDMLSLQARVLGRDAELRGKLRVSTFDVLFYSLERAFTSFLERYPHVELSVATSPERVSLPRREADVAIRLSNAPPENLVGRRVGYMQFGVYAARTLVERVGEDAPLGAYPWLSWDAGENLAWFEGWLAENAPHAKIVLRLGDRGLLMAHAVRSGIGAQILPCVLADADPFLQRLSPLQDLFRLDLWLLTLPELRSNSRVRAFMEHMSEALRSHRDALTGESARGRHQRSAQS